MWALTTSGPKGSLGTSHRMEVVPVSALILVCWPSSSSGNYILPDPNPPGKFSPFVCLLVIFFFKFLWCFALDMAFFLQRVCLSKRGQRWVDPLALCIIFRKIVGWSKGCRRAEQSRNPGEWETSGDTLMNSLPQAGVWWNYWCYSLTSWDKASVSLWS